MSTHVKYSQVEAIRRDVACGLKSKQMMHAYACEMCGRERILRPSSARLYKKCVKCRSVKHGFTTHTSKQAIYSVWRGMLGRCKYPNAPRYECYGGRGISVYKEWEDFDTFRHWAMSAGWVQGMQIDRIDNDGNYSPENCRIATPAENMQNSRMAKLTKDDVRCIRMLMWSGLTSPQVATIFGVRRQTVNSIMRWKAWSNV